MDNLREQFSQIYDQYIDKIYRFVYLKVNSQETAEDITSKVFTRGWESFRKQKMDIKNHGAFLYKIARNAVIDHYREKSRTNIVSTETLAQFADDGVKIEEKAILGADIKIIKTAVQRLKKDHQNIIIWHYLDDMSIADIALAMGKPEGTVRVMLHRGLKELRGIVQNS